MPALFKVSLENDVLDFVSQADPQTLWYWNVSLSVIAEDPFPRYGYYSEHIGLGLPAITYNYWITDIPVGSGSRTMTFTAEYWDYRPVYVVNEEGHEVIFFAVRAKWVYDPLDDE